MSLSYLPLKRLTKKISLGYTFCFWVLLSKYKRTLVTKTLKHRYIDTLLSKTWNWTKIRRSRCISLYSVNRVFLDLSRFRLDYYGILMSQLWKKKPEISSFSPIILVDREQK